MESVSAFAVEDNLSATRSSVSNGTRRSSIPPAAGFSATHPAAEASPAPESGSVPARQTTFPDSSVPSNQRSSDVPYAARFCVWSR
jgi:hypothetical protein